MPWVQVGSGIYGGSAGDSFGVSLDMSADGKTVAIGGDGTTGVYQEPENAYADWSQVGPNVPSEKGGYSSTIGISANGGVVAMGTFVLLGGATFRSC